MKLSRNAKRAIAKYGAALCKFCFVKNEAHGEGPSTIAFTVYGIPNTNAANAAINAGRELARGAA